MAHIVSPVETWAQRQGERIVVQHNEHVSSAHQLHQQVACSSWCLSTVHGVQPGDRVALLGLNTASFFVTFLAIADSGAIVCPINWRWTPQELAQALGAISPRLLLYDPDFQQLAQQALALVAGQRPPAAVSMEQLVQTSAHPPMAASSSTVAVDGAQQLQLRRPTDGAALIVFTSGTTGASKAAVLSHDALMHQVGGWVAEAGSASPAALSHCMLPVAPQPGAAVNAITCLQQATAWDISQQDRCSMYNAAHSAQLCGYRPHPNPPLAACSPWPSW
jgi:acyl-CoA synthetase (AMP-forming)/AMP-acid ligase II